MNLKKEPIVIISSVLLFFVLYFSLTNVEWDVRVILSLMISSVMLWVFEPIPFSQSSMLLIILFILFDVSSTEVILSGFSSNALFLVLGGLMLGKGVNDTLLGRRLALFILTKFLKMKGGLLFGVIIIQQVFSIFIPAPVIRTAILIPILQNIFLQSKSTKLFEKQIMMGLAYGGNISSIGFLPAAVINVITGKSVV